MIYRLLNFIKSRPTRAAMIGAGILIYGPLAWLFTLAWATTEVANAQADPLDAAAIISRAVSFSPLIFVLFAVSLSAAIGLTVYALWRRHRKLP